MTDTIENCRHCGSPCENSCTWTLGASKAMDAACGENPQTGWTYSDNEEHWRSTTGFATREEALEEARSELSYREVGLSIWTGFAVRIESADVVESIDGDSMIECMDQAIYDQVGGECDYQVDATKDQIAELESEARAVTLAWLERHNVMPRVYTVDNVLSHTVIGYDEDGLVLDGEALPERPLSDPSETVASHARTPASSSSSSSSPGCD